MLSEKTFLKKNSASGARRAAAAGYAETDHSDVKQKQTHKKSLER